jgi:hypothetical protein
LFSSIFAKLSLVFFLPSLFFIIFSI